MWKLRDAMCFQGVQWMGIKKVWWRLLPMLKCWTILVPLNLMSGFEGVISSLENIAAAQEVIASGQAMPTSIVPDGSGGNQTNGLLFEPS
jgi:hypothetical protein